MTAAPPARARPEPSTGGGARRSRRWPLARRAGGGQLRLALVLLLPAALVVFGVVLYPAGRALVISFYDVDSPFPGRYPFVGLHNYTEVLADPRLWAAVGHTAYFTLVSTMLELVLGLGLAHLLAAPLRLRWLFRAIVILPWALPTIVNGAMWRWVLNAQYGVANALLTDLHLQGGYRSWLGNDPFLALNMVIVADVWKNTSLVAFFLLAGLQTIPSGLFEAARVDGAGPVRSFFRITLPLLVPNIALVLVLRTIEAFKVFDIIYVMTGGGPASGTQTVTFFTYLQAFSAQRFSTGASLAYLTVVAVLLLALVYLRLLRQSELRSP
ncbi:ABC transporter permease subunit [Micromonospora terminaliae]|uniref:ABC transporter permease subunit n=1 Tax=Micromonospora terminaliae TaxID=1914461 RepID=A0AAJ3DJ71_9ACTN|nr:sugar ABC transporter permease [Micromonospora terminaliae]NES27993.1 sugar ABC transporter permease [Micromonospora terminaliae]QGL47246.1 ABC transporter permease subunit [Micromonospora terminaliae]